MYEQARGCRRNKSSQERVREKEKEKEKRSYEIEVSSRTMKRNEARAARHYLTLLHLCRFRISPSFFSPFFAHYIYSIDTRYALQLGTPDEITELYLDSSFYIGEVKLC